MPEKVLSVLPPTICNNVGVHALRSYGAHNRYAVQLILRSINMARSAFVAITFRNETFDAFDVYETVIVQAGVLIKVSGAAIDGTSSITFLTHSENYLHRSINLSTVCPRSKWRLCSGRSAYLRSCSSSWSRPTPCGRL